MSLLLLVVLVLLPLAAWLDWKRAPRRDPAPPSAAAPASRWTTFTLIGVVATAATIGFAATLYVNRYFLCDDAFITYRYADNLQLGCGFTWNCGASPVEGYTNFALVVLLAPLLKLRIDPLFAARFIGVLSAAGIIYLIFRTARRHYGADRPAAALVAFTFLPISATAQVASIGLETLAYALGLLATAHLVGRGLEEEVPDRRSVAAAALAQLIVLLLRPEGALLLPVMLAVALTTRDIRWVSRYLRTFVPLFGVPFALYLLWKGIHFHSLLPAPFFLKAAQQGWSSPLGLRSVHEFLLNHWKLVALVLTSALLPSPAPRQRLLYSVSVAVYLLFYQRVDTLVDPFGRFLYPLTPLLFILAIPAIHLFWSHLIRWKANGSIKLVFGTTTALMLFVVNPISAFEDVETAVKGGPPPPAKDDLGQREKLIGQTLRQYPGIEQTIVAFGDAGVIPYYSRSLHLDTVGLNDRFISRERDRTKLLDYFFSTSPDVVIQPATATGWITFGHGPLGDYQNWSNDVRWNDYQYAGVLHSAIYNLHFFVRKQNAKFDQLMRFVRSRLVDPGPDKPPFPIGGPTN